MGTSASRRNVENRREVLLEVDSRHRVVLSKLARPGDNRYLATSDPDGSIHLTPATVLSHLEVEMLAHPEVVERIKANREDPGRLVKRSRREQ